VRRLWLIGFLAAGCVPARLEPPTSPTVRWVPVEMAASRLDYPAGDGAIDHGARVLVLVQAPASPRGRRAAPEILLPDRVEVGEIFRIGIRVPRANDDDLRTFRILCGRRGLRLLDGDLVETRGRRVAERRAVADSAGPATFDLEDAGD
jgi:hypothetical protein